MTTAISWTDETWNPSVGCSRVSPGCDNCYAMRVAHRGLSAEHRGLTLVGEHGVDWTGDVRQLPDRLDTPLRWRKPRRVFVDSMSDLFHPAVPADFVAKVFAVMAVTRQHMFQVLTKRPQRMASTLGAVSWEDRVGLAAGETITGPFIDWCRVEYPEIGDTGWLPNVWLGTSIESDRYAWRADHVRATPAAVRFLSLEPLLGPLPSLDLTGIDWVIVGGESGPGWRRMHMNWLADIVAACDTAGVALFVKQDSGPRAGQQGAIPDVIWARKEYPR